MVLGLAFRIFYPSCYIILTIESVYVMGDKMRVLYILDPATVGGATNAFLTLIRELINKGVEPIVCMSRDGEGVSKELRSLNVPVYEIGHDEMITKLDKGNGWKSVKRNTKKFVKYVWHDIKAIKQIKKELDLKEIDVIHTNSSRSDVGFYLNMFYRIPHLVHLRESDNVVRPLNPLYVPIYNRFADKFVCVSESVRDYWTAKGIKKSKTCVVYDGIYYQDINESGVETKMNNELKVIMTGAISELKGQDLSIKALGMIPKEIRRCIHVDYYGWTNDYYLNLLKNLAKQVGVLDNVSFMGKTSRENVHKLLGNYQLGLMCSKTEGFGLVTAEYMFAKLGVIASDAGASPELIKNGKTGLVFKSGDAESLKDAIVYYYTNRNVLVKHSVAAREDALLRFTSEINAANVYLRYEELLNK